MLDHAGFCTINSRSLLGEPYAEISWVAVKELKLSYHDVDI